MNQDIETRAYVAWNLEEAQEALTKIIAGMTPEAEIDEGALRWDLAHVYHHLNTAWNARNAIEGEILSQEHFDRWRRFPDDLESTGKTAV